MRAGILAARIARTALPVLAAVALLLVAAPTTSDAQVPSRPMAVEPTPTPTPTSGLTVLLDLGGIDLGLVLPLSVPGLLELGQSPAPTPTPSAPTPSAPPSTPTTAPRTAQPINPAPSVRVSQRSTRSGVAANSDTPVSGQAELPVAAPSRDRPTPSATAEPSRRPLTVTNLFQTAFRPGSPVGLLIVLTAICAVGVAGFVVLAGRRGRRGRRSN